ncbi:hypothetical protein PHSY_004346 [Pseudozyma hubeiensis SY62]|uniref:Uncharacterized protein n=1 Tax=Pseudozyma hubeiensis (strain SY62) TaxID=1305764 RepID=R9P691_PSEHS|nr:hypothetical protein PHSY_004346 [Pseudozyma hubeiensis SY62]GAC96762.1 hypothetical protein PHSY_004346 [Pseudozyma hubeiensis SY62]
MLVLCSHAFIVGGPTVRRASVTRSERLSLVTSRQKDRQIRAREKSAGPSSAAKRTPIPPRSSHILVTDTIDSPALFVLIHFLRASHAVNRLHRSAGTSPHADTKGKSRAHTKVIWLGCSSDGSAHLNNVVRKSSVHLDQETRDGAFSYIDAGAQALAPFEDDNVTDAVASMHVSDVESTAEQVLHRLYSNVAEQLQDPSLIAHQQSSEPDWASRALIVVDDLTALAWALDSHDMSGHPIDAPRLLTNWLAALTLLATNNHASVITLMHSDATSSSKDGASDRSDESLFSSLLQRADVWIEVKELASGRARDCDGEITVHQLVRPSLARSISASKASNTGRDRVQGDVPPLQAFAIETPCPSRAKAVLYRIAPDGQSAALGGASVRSNTGRVQIWARGTGRGFL